jgi:hypothetical protein
MARQSLWKDFKLYLGYFFLCLLFAVIGTYGVVSSLEKLHKEKRSFQMERLWYRRSPERRIVLGSLYGLMGVTGATIYVWFLIKEVRKNQRIGKQ